LTFVGGIFTESFVKIPLIALGGIFILALAAASVFWAKDKRAVVTAFCCAVFALGAWRGLAVTSQDTLSRLNDKGRLTVVGQVAEPPDRGKITQKLKIKAEKVILFEKEMPISGFLLADAELYPEYNYGDVLAAGGQLKEPVNSADFDYKTYLAKSDIYSVMSYPEIKILAVGRGNKVKQVLFSLKQRYESAIGALMGEPQAGFLAGLNLGENKQISPELSEAFKKSGTSHIVALSGYNISIIAAFIMTIFGWLMLRRSLRFWLAVGAIVFFTILTGASASVTRAAIMGILVLLARHEGRMYNVRNALVFAGAVMIFFNPMILRFDIGFQLSFCATAGLVWLAPVFSKWFAKLPKFFGLKEILIATLSAQLAVLPLLLVYFSQLSLISPLANLVVLLFIPSTMLVGFVAGVVGMMWLAAAKIFGWIAWLFLTFELTAIKFFAGLPLASLSVKWGWSSAVIYYLILLGLLYRFHQRQKKEILAEQWAEK
jgi:competence protein ComEC